jgi:hypothetical protein
LNCHSVLYEEITDPAEGQQARAAVAAFLGVSPPIGFSSSYQKVTPPPHVMVRNWDEIVQSCRENDLAQYLLPSARPTAPTQAADRAMAEGDRTSTDAKT